MCQFCKFMSLIIFLRVCLLCFCITACVIVLIASISEGNVALVELCTVHQGSCHGTWSDGSVLGTSTGRIPLLHQGIQCM